MRTDRTLSPRRLSSTCLALLAFSWLGVAGADEAQPLPRFNIDVRETSVSGLSSGGFMAVQFQIAHAAIVKGSGIVAAGPYYCAQDNVLIATTRCSCTLDPSHSMCDIGAGSTDVAELAAATRRFAHAGWIDDPHHIAGQRTLMIAGGKDRTVPAAVVAQLRDYLATMGMPAQNMSLVTLADAGHGMPTATFGGSCDVTGEPYVNSCHFDAAGKLLAWIYGPLQPARSGARQGRFIRFNQRPYVGGGPFNWTSGLDSTGWIYVPDTCSRGEACRLHVALHGCRQGQSYSALAWGGAYGTTFVEHAGYDAWADTNHLVILFPQAVSTLFTNPNGCWDWWGYTGAHYADRQGVQIQAIRAMVDRLAGAAR